MFLTRSRTPRGSWQSQNSNLLFASVIWTAFFPHSWAATASVARPDAQGPLSATCALGGVCWVFLGVGEKSSRHHRINIIKDGTMCACITQGMTKWDSHNGSQFTQLSLWIPAMGWSPFLAGSYPSTSAFVYLPGRDKYLGTLHRAVAGESTWCFLHDFECWEMPNVCLHSHESIPKLQSRTLFLGIQAKTMHCIRGNHKIWREIMSTRDLCEATHHSHLVHRHMGFWGDVTPADVKLLHWPQHCPRMGNEERGLPGQGKNGTQVQTIQLEREIRKQEKRKEGTANSSATLIYRDGYLSVGSWVWCGRRLWCYFS